ncbi:MAG: hypothetical protein ACLFUO_03650 [Candidatus Woesearchaeota archaeon]
MDPVKKTLDLERNAHKKEDEIEDKSEKEYEDTLRVSKESLEMDSLKNNLYFKNFADLEKRFIAELKKIKDSEKAMKKPSLSFPEFRKLVSDFVLALGNLEEFREKIVIHIDALIRQDEEIISLIKKKMSLEGSEIKDKDQELSLRKYMFSSKNINKYLDDILKRKVADTGEIETIRSEQLKALDIERVDLEKLRRDAIRENDTALAILTEIKQLKKINDIEGVLIENIARIISLNNFLERNDFPQSSVLEEFALSIDELRKLIATEIHLLSIIPGQVVLLKNDELLDSEDFQYLKDLTKISDIPDDEMQ